MAFMFVLALASVNLASAKPICTECGNNRTSDSASKAVSVEKSFVVHVSVNLLSRVFKKTVT